MEAAYTTDDARLLRVFIDMATKAAAAAEKACARAQLTQGEHDAQTLKGYAEEAGLFMDKAKDMAYEFSRGHAEALHTGAAIYVESLRKSEETDQALLLDTEDHSVRRTAAIKLARRLKEKYGLQVTLRFGDQELTYVD
jgi:hypothetical protein